MAAKKQYPIVRLAEADELVNIVSALNSIVPVQKSGDALIGLEFSKDALTVAASDEVKSVVGFIREPVLVESTADVFTCVPYAVFSTLIKRLKKKAPVEFTIKRGSIHYKTPTISGSLTTASGVDADAFLGGVSVFSVDDSPNNLSINTEDVDVILRYMLFDTFGFGDAQPSVRLRTFDDKVVFVSADKFSGAMYIPPKTKYPENADGLTLPSSILRAVNVISKASRGKDTASVSLTPKTVKVETDTLVAVLPVEDVDTFYDITELLPSLSNQKPVACFSVTSKDIADMLGDVLAISEINKVTPVNIAVSRSGTLLMSTRTLYGKAERRTEKAANKVKIFDGSASIKFTVYSKILNEFATAFRDAVVTLTIYESFVVQKVPKLGVTYVYSIYDEREGE